MLCIYMTFLNEKLQKHLKTLSLLIPCFSQKANSMFTSMAHKDV